MEEFSKSHTGRPMSEESKKIIAAWYGYEMGKVNRKDLGTPEDAERFVGRVNALIKLGHIIGKARQRRNIVEMRREG